MNTVTRGIRNAFRNTIRTGSIVLILGLSIGLIVAMLAARQAVDDKITAIKTSVGNTITIQPAGYGGGQGGGEALTTTQLASISNTKHVTGTLATLRDRLTTSNTNLVSSIEPGSLGQRGADNSGVGFQAPPSDSQRPEGSSDSNSSGTTITRTFTMPLELTGISDATKASTYGGTTLTWTSGEAFDASKDANAAVVGTALATKNSLSVGSTFTAYNTTITVVGIYDAGSTFANNGVFMPLSTVQRLSSQDSAITSITAYVDTSDNLATVTSALKSTLGDKADVTNSQDTADSTVQPLESVKTISLFSLIGAIAAGAIIILLTMMMIVRERRREIGVMKAIGSSNVKIMGQFVVESITLTALGLVLGLGIGVAASTPLTNALVSNNSSTSTTTTATRGMGAGGFGMRSLATSSQQTIKNIEASVGYQTLLLGLGASVLIAIIGSAVPSFLISKIKPAEAMRNE